MAMAVGAEMTTRWEEILESANLYEQFSSSGVDYGMVAEQLRKVTGAMAVAIASYLDEGHAVKAEAVAAPQGVLEKARAYLGYEPVGTTWRMRDEDLAGNRLGRLIRLDGLHELSFGHIPQPVCNALEYVLGIRDVYAIGLVHQGELLGAAAIIMSDISGPSTTSASSTLDTGMVEVHARLLAANIHRREVETARARTEDRWRSFVEHARDGVFVVNKRARYIEVNPATCEMLGFSREELLTMGIPDPASLAQPEDSVSFGILVERGEYFGEVTLRRKDGLQVPVEINAARLPDGNYLGTARDITERKRAEESLVKQTALEQRDRARLEFLQVAAHELRTPMTAVKGSCALLHRIVPPGEYPPTMERLFEVLDREVNHLSSLLDEILEAFRIQGGHLSLAFERVDLQSLVPESLALFTLGEEGQRIVFEGTEAGESVVEGDPRRLDEVIRNLVHNALKYSGNAAKVVVKLAVREGKALLTVTDRGIGIPASELSTVFEAFHRASNLEGRDPGGLGLGLKICRDIVQRHHGRIWAESDPGWETTFFVELPLAGAGGSEA